MKLFGQQFACGGEQFGRVLWNPISAITSIAGGIIGSNAASNAASTIDTADKAAGSSAISTAAAVNPNITGAATTAGTGAVTAAQNAGTGAVNAAETAGTDVTGAAGTAASGVNTATTGANALLNPYAATGAQATQQLAAGLAPGGNLNATPTMSQLQIDPGYAFRLQQGQTALDRSAAARGGATGGAAIKATTDYAQGAASQEYQNAFNRFETSNQNNVANLQGASNAGQLAATQQGTNSIGAGMYGGNMTTNAAQYAGTARTQASQYAGTAAMNASQYAGTAGINAANLTSANTINAQTQANQYNVAGATALGQGMVGSANAWTGALNGVGNAAMYSGFGDNLFGNPATSAPVPMFSNGQSLQVGGALGQAATGVL